MSNFRSLFESPRRLLLIDVVGALVTSGLTALILATGYLPTGIPIETFRWLAIIAAGLAVFGLSGLLFANDFRKPLRWLAVLNASYCVAVLMLCWANGKSLTWLGLVYLSVEVAVVLILAWWEWRVSQGVSLWPKIWWLRVMIVSLIIVLLPYLFSRIAGPTRRISIQKLDPNIVSAPERDGHSLRIGCYNIAHGRGLADSNHDGGDRRTRIERLDSIAALLKEVDADLVVLNEVDFNTSWSYGVNQARYLAEKAGYPYWVEQRNLDFRVLPWTWCFGNVVLSRFPIENASLIPLPPHSQWESLIVGQKQGVLCDINCNGQRIQLMALHLEHRTEEIRVSSVKSILDFMNQNQIKNDSIFLIGDLNSTPGRFPFSTTSANGENAIELLDQSGWVHRRPEQDPTERDFTFRSDKPVRVIDWIMIPVGWQFLDYEVHPSRLSDHRLIFADVIVEAKRQIFHGTSYSAGGVQCR